MNQMTTSSARRRLSWLLPCVTAAVTLVTSQYANADLAFIITGTNGATNFVVPNTGGTYQFVVFGLIQDSAASGSSNVGGPDPNGADGISATQLGAALTANSGLISDAFFQHTGSSATVAYQPSASAQATATQLWSSGTTIIGIGATDPAQTSRGHAFEQYDLFVLHECYFALQRTR